MQIVVGIQTVLCYLLVLRCWPSCSGSGDSNNNKNNIKGAKVINATREREDAAIGLHAFVSSLRTRFENRFENSCRKYPFVKKYEDMMRHPPEKFLWFVFEENGQSSTGGLGDRLAGLVTATAMALRFNRTLLIDSVDPFNSLFFPHHIVSRSHGQHHLNSDSSELVSYANISWSNWKGSYAANTAWMRCVNPKPHRSVCAFDQDHYDSNVAIRYYCNRSYLCRWLALRDQTLSKELLTILGIDDDTNLYEVAGCLLRLAMTPSELMWQQITSLLRFANSKHISFHTDSRLIGVHFRCGDSSFSENKINPQCVVVTNKTWQGTNFGDDISRASPIDLADCAKRSLVDYEKDFINVASDNQHSANQIHEHLDSLRVLHMPKSCHIDSHQGVSCESSTLTQWLLLSLSDVIVTQPLDSFQDSAYQDDPNRMASLLKGKKTDKAAISAFSRMASIYGLQSDNLRYGGECRTLNVTSIGHHSHGNWACLSKMFYRP
jgi:hypothetical protein